MKQVNHRRERFIAEYLATGNATEAAKRAGYSPKTAKAQGSRLLTKDDIKSELTRKRAVMNIKTEWTHEIALRESVEQYNRLKLYRPDYAYKYKENADRLNGLLVDKTDNLNRNMTIDDGELKKRAAEEAIKMLTEAEGAISEAASQSVGESLADEG